jgi:hypothetical protein
MVRDHGGRKRKMVGGATSQCMFLFIILIAEPCKYIASSESKFILSAT